MKPRYHHSVVWPSTKMYGWNEFFMQNSASIASGACSLNNRSSWLYAFKYEEPTVRGLYLAPHSVPKEIKSNEWKFEKKKLENSSATLSIQRKKRFCFQSQFRWKKWVCVWHRVLLIQHALISAYNTLSMKTTFTDVMMLCIHIPTLFADYKSLSKRIFNGPFAWHPFRNCVNKRVYSTWHSAQKKRPMHKLI